MKKMKNIHKKEYPTTLDEYNKLVNSLDDANKFFYKLVLENLELESNILSLKELFEKVLREHIVLPELRDFYRNKINVL
jgi:hypothetical protein